MFVTAALRTQVKELLEYLTVRSDYLLAITADAHWTEQSERCWAVERALYVSIECVTDVASVVIDTLVMRDPANYEDMLRVFEEEHVVSSDWCNAFVPIFALRSRLVRSYMNLTAADLSAAVSRYAPLFAAFVTSVQTYLRLDDHP